MGCELEVYVENDMVSSVTGNKCRRGEAYAVEECINPVRTVTTTVRVYGGSLPLLPVKSEKPISKHKIRDCVAALKQIQLHAPVKIGDIVVENVCNTGINVVACRDID